MESLSEGCSGCVGPTEPSIYRSDFRSLYELHHLLGGPKPLSEPACRDGTCPQLAFAMSLWSILCTSRYLGVVRPAGGRLVHGSLRCDVARQDLARNVLMRQIVTMNNYHQSTLGASGARSSLRCALLSRRCWEDET